jgi:hypothetical protein
MLSKVFNLQTPFSKFGLCKRSNFIRPVFLSLFSPLLTVKLPVWVVYNFFDLSAIEHTLRSNNRSNRRSIIAMIILPPRAIFALCFLLYGPALVFLQAEEKKSYIVGTFLTGLGQHLDKSTTQGGGTNVEWINGGTVYWSNLEENTNDITVSWPLIFDIKLMSKFGFGFTFGDLLTISMNKYYQDANHLYFGLSYVHPIKRWDIGASLIVFPVYIANDELLAAKFDASYWFIKDDIGITMSTMIGATTGWSGVHVLLFNVSAGLSIKFKMQR